MEDDAAVTQLAWCCFFNQQNRFQLHVHSLNMTKHHSIRQSAPLYINIDLIHKTNKKKNISAHLWLYMFSCFIVMQKHSSCMIHGLNLGFNCSYLTLDKFINLAEQAYPLSWKVQSFYFEIPHQWEVSCSSNRDKKVSRKTEQLYTLNLQFRYRKQRKSLLL